MKFEIDVVENGMYVIELLYRCQENPLGSEFEVFTQHDSGNVIIANLIKK